jgi:hypothetical protein
MADSQDKHWRERLQDVLAVGDLEDHGQLVKSLLESLKRDPHPKVRQAATEMLFTHDENAVQTLLDEHSGEGFWLDDDSVCDLASMAMTRIGQALESLGEQAVEPLIDALEKRDDWREIESIIGILGRINDVRAIEPLTALIQRMDVRHCAFEAIKRIAARHRLRDIPILKNPPNFVTIADSISRLRSERVPCGKDVYIEFEALESHRTVKVVKFPYDFSWTVHFDVDSTEELSCAVSRFRRFGTERIENPEALFEQLVEAKSQDKETSIPVQAIVCSVNADFSVESILENVYQLAPDCQLSIKENTSRLVEGQPKASPYANIEPRERHHTLKDDQADPRFAVIVAMEASVPNISPSGELGKLSLEEFLERLKNKGFEASPRSNRLYYNPGIPAVRFAIRKRVIRLERKAAKRQKQVWRLVRSFLISRQTHLALKAADVLLGSEQGAG